MIDKRTVLLVLGVLGVLGLCEGRKYGVLCRVKDPQIANNYNVLKDCLYEVYPVETTQLSGNLHDGVRNHNRLFALYGGSSSCSYFGNLIRTQKGKQTLVDTIKKQLQKSGYRGLDLQCDPAQAQVSQQDYVDFLDFLRSQIGGGYIISVSVKNLNVDPNVVHTLNNAVDFVSVLQDGNAKQIQNLLSYGLAKKKAVVEIPFPVVINCPLDNGIHSSHSIVKNAVRVIQNHDLLGATIQLDRDDTAGVCGKGTFPLFRLLIDQLDTCGSMIGTESKARCNFNGYVRDPRDCSSFYTCNSGVQHHLQCPQGMSFDVCSGSCQPFLQVNCNSTTCTLIGAINGGGNRIPIPIPYPFPFPGNCNGSSWNNGNNGNNGHNGTNGTNGTVIHTNITEIVIINQMSELLKLLNETDLENTVGILNHALRDVYPPLREVVEQVNHLLSNLLLGNRAINNTMGQMDEMQRKLGILESLLVALFRLLDNLLGFDFSGAMIGGGPPPHGGGPPPHGGGPPPHGGGPPPLPGGGPPTPGGGPPGGGPPGGRRGASDETTGIGILGIL